MHIYIGIHGSVLAIDRATGKEAWETSLKGADFVNVVLDGNELYAGSKGRLYRLDPATGNTMWVNELPGKGWGMISIAQSPDGNRGAMVEKRRQDEAAAAASTTAATT